MDVTCPAHRHWKFWLFSLSPLVIAIPMAIEVSEGYVPGWSPEAIQKFQELMSVPVWVGALCPIIAAIYLTIFRSSQSAKQISLQIEQNTLTNYYKHKEELADLLESTKIADDRKINSRELHNRAFPDFLKGETVIDKNWAGSIESCLLSVMMELNERIHDLSERRWNFSKLSSSILDNIKIITTLIGFERKDINDSCQLFNCRLDGPMYKDIEALISLTERTVSSLYILNREDVPDYLSAHCSTIEAYCQVITKEWENSLNKFLSISRFIPLVIQNQPKFRNTHTKFIEVIESLDASEAELLNFWSATPIDEVNRALSICGLELGVSLE